MTMGGRTAPFLYVSPVQINFEIPAGTSAGDVPLNVQTGLGGTLNFFLKVAAIAPSLFTANGDGRGVVAASAVTMCVAQQQGPYILTLMRYCRDDHGFACIHDTEVREFSTTAEPGLLRILCRNIITGRLAVDLSCGRGRCANTLEG
jgi:hypothetical protein